MDQLEAHPVTLLHADVSGIHSHVWIPHQPYQIVLFYRYVPVITADFDGFVDAYRTRLGSELGLLGRLLISAEGFNGTLAGSSACLTVFMNEFESQYGGGTVDWKLTDVAEGNESLPFLNLSVRWVSEIISTGKEGKRTIDQQVCFDASTFGGLSGTGQHLTPEEFHAHISTRDKDKSLLLDIRNGFEHTIGSFEGSVPLGTVTYSQTWRRMDSILAEAATTAETPIYMYCTGGIRCEKASAYLKAKGHANVFQLQGGIHRYLELIPPEDSKFVGKNFVFDSRVTVGGSHEQAKADAEAERGEADVTAVMGTCLHCTMPHDAYSGSICCTVCRQPCLYCPKCVKANPNPGEYHCSRHLHLRLAYFTVLAPFSDEQLEAQRRQLDDMQAVLLQLPPKERIRAKNKRRTLRRQAEKVAAELERRKGREVNDSTLSYSPMTLTGRGFWKD